MKAHRLTRDWLGVRANHDLVLAHDVRDAAGRTVLGKGSRLTADAVARLADLAWDELHVVELLPGDVHELDAGRRLAQAIAGADIRVGAMTAGHWPLCAATRGMLHVQRSALDAINALEGVAVYTLFDGQVVDERETVARGKIIPFAIPEQSLQRAEAIAREQGSIVGVRRFRPLTVGAVIQESLGDRAMARVHAVLAEKVAWFGAALVSPRFVSPNHADIAAALRASIADGARVILVAGSRAMDPLDPVYAALEGVGGRLERCGIPAHPGSLLWVGSVSCGVDDVAIIGLPSCGLFSQASVFDLLLPRLLTGERLTNSLLAEFGHGGLLTRDMPFRFPPYRRGGRRGEVLEE